MVSLAKMAATLPVIAMLVMAGCAASQPVNTTANSPFENLSTETPMTFEAQNGDTVAAFQGTVSVPENRSAQNGRTLTLHYVRFPATGDTLGSPIVYLAGGPGGSGIAAARHQRFPLFMAMREFGDVIAFDQRGTGASNEAPTCTSSQTDDPAVAIPDLEYFQRRRLAFRECLGFWRDAGVDVRGYNTRENVADLDALRRHLGAEKISLWGISYGSHLALAALSEMDEHLDRVVISSVEGLDQTIKMPARTDDYFARLQEAVNSQPAARAAFPDIGALIRRVHARLEDEPVMLEIPQADGETANILLERRDMQELAGSLIGDPLPAAALLQIYAGLENGETDLLLAVLQQFHNPDPAIAYRPMSILMDIASGTGTARRAEITEQAETSLLGPFLNGTMELETVDPSLVLDDDFRTLPVSDVSVLVLSGTLDGRTYIDSQAEAVSGLRNRQMVTVVNGGHNLFMSSPEITAVIQAFMRGEPVGNRAVEIELQNFLTADFGL